MPQKLFSPVRDSSANRTNVTVEGSFWKVPCCAVFDCGAHIVLPNDAIAGWWELRSAQRIQRIGFVIRPRAEQAETQKCRAQLPHLRIRFDLMAHCAGL